MRRPLGLPFIKLVEMSDTLVANRVRGFGSRADPSASCARSRQTRPCARPETPHPSRFLQSPLIRSGPAVEWRYVTSLIELVEMRGAPSPLSQRLAVFTSACASLVCHPQISLESLDRDARQGPRVCRWSLVDCRHAPDPAPATHIVVAFVNVAVDIVFASRGCAACVVGGVWAVADRTGLGRDPPAGQRTTHARGTGRPGHAVR